MSEILPCPFCGGKAEWKSGGPGCAWIACKSCPAETGDGSIPRIIEAWNRRAIPATDARADALREAVKALRDWQDALIANGLHETALTVGMAADAVLALIGEAKP